MTIHLGDKVRDKVTGFTGIAVAKTEFINGCIQFNVAPKCEKSNKQIEELSFDENFLEVIKKNEITRRITPHTKVQTNGGPTHKGFKMRGY